MSSDCDDESRVFYDMPLRVLRSGKDKHHHHHHHHRHHHCQAKTTLVPIRVCLEHKPVILKNSATQTSLTERPAGAKNAQNPVSRSRAEDRYPIFTRKIVSLIDRSSGRSCRRSSTSHTVPVPNRPPAVRVQTTIRSSSFPRTESRFSIQTRPAVRTTRSFTNLPKDKLNELLLIANVEKQNEEILRQEEEIKCRKNKPYDVDEVHEYMKTKELLRSRPPVKEVTPVTHKEKPYDASEIRKFIEEKRRQERESKDREHEAHKKGQPVPQVSGKPSTENCQFSRDPERNPLVEKERDRITATKAKGDARMKILKKISGEAPVATEREVKEILENVLTVQPEVPEIQLSKFPDLPPLSDISFHPKEIPFTAFDQLLDKRNLTFNQSMLTNNLDSKATLTKVSLDISSIFDKNDSSFLSEKIPEEELIEKERRQDSPISYKERMIGSLVDQEGSYEKTSDNKLWADEDQKNLNKTIDNLIAEGLRRERQSFEKLIEEALSNSLFKGDPIRDDSPRLSSASSSNNSPTCESLPQDDSLPDSFPKRHNNQQQDRNSSNVSVYVQHDPNKCVSCFFDSDESAASLSSGSGKSYVLDDFKVTQRDKEENHMSAEESAAANTNNSLNNLLNTSAANLSISDRIDQIRSHTKSSSIQVQNDPGSLRNQSNLFKITSDIDLENDGPENDNYLDEDTYNVSSILSDVVSIPATSDLESGKDETREQQPAVVEVAEAIAPLAESTAVKEVAREELTPERTACLVREISHAVFESRTAGNPDDWKWRVLQEQGSWSKQIFAYKKFLADLVSDLMPRIFRPDAPSASASIRGIAKFARQLPFPAGEEEVFHILLQNVLNETQSLIRNKEKRGDIKKDGLVGLFKKSVPREPIDELVLQDLAEENSEWYDYSAEVISILGHLGEDLAYDLIDELAANIAKQQLAHKTEKRNRTK